jgi:hypothetical protein
MTQLPDGTRIENWTGVKVRFVDIDAGISVEIPVEYGGPAHVRMDHEEIPGSKYVTRTVFAEEDNLPDEKDGVYLVVSSVFKGLYPDRSDLVVPNMIIRDRQEHRVVACQGFAV